MTNVTDVAEIGGLALGALGLIGGAIQFVLHQASGGDVVTELRGQIADQAKRITQLEAEVRAGREERDREAEKHAEDMDVLRSSYDQRIDSLQNEVRSLLQRRS